MKFIDLFAGLGGFHLALSSQGHKCVYACELDNTLRDFYEKNFDLKSDGDITKIDINTIFYALVFHANLFQKPAKVRVLIIKLQEKCSSTYLKS